jgi:hypothetical protein
MIDAFFIFYRIEEFLVAKASDPDRTAAAAVVTTTAAGRGTPESLAN